MEDMVLPPFSGAWLQCCAINRSIVARKPQQMKFARVDQAVSPTFLGFTEMNQSTGLFVSKLLMYGRLSLC